MNGFVAAAIAVAGITVTPILTLASNDREEIEEACRQVAMDENVELLEIRDFIADCIALNLAVEEGGDAGEKEDGSETIGAEQE